MKITTKKWDYVSERLFWSLYSRVFVLRSFFGTLFVSLRRSVLVSCLWVGSFAPLLPHVALIHMDVRHPRQSHAYLHNPPSHWSPLTLFGVDATSTHEKLIPIWIGLLSLLNFFLTICFVIHTVRKNLRSDNNLIQTRISFSWVAVASIPNKIRGDHWERGYVGKREAGEGGIHPYG